MITGDHEDFGAHCLERLYRLFCTWFHGVCDTDESDDIVLAHKDHGSLPLCFERLEYWLYRRECDSSIFQECTITDRVLGSVDRSRDAFPCVDCEVCDRRTLDTALLCFIPDGKRERMLGLTLETCCYP